LRFALTGLELIHQRVAVAPIAGQLSQERDRAVEGVVVAEARYEDSACG
jgi:hypothetical protein